MKKRLAMLIALGTTVLALLPADPAAAHTVRYGTVSSFGLTASGGEAALGRVSSPNAACVNNRKVKLYLVRPGRDLQVGVDRRTGVPSGNGDGYWVVPTNLRPGRSYYAVVGAKDLAAGSHLHLCKEYRTSVVPWQPA
ncbi:hypothetical protein [Nocardioides bizhenqiangii]|uniref:Secreted protein n=1 Tax=Nocardioides bizhenqiangii TaxID=3095076 RepID=A0ABZ0ZQE0_9ACTN|nr:MULTISPECIES: hypothetical protein [unclassified Nocardioides]MDZ5619480.1 hypothetical protein [Nocardioides sp. HM23]WQQ26503.1 hypothetical protein SHK19_21420 [Nocardioides sp. HM61]